MALVNATHVGLVVYSRDGKKIGKIKDLVSDRKALSVYVVIGRGLGHDLLIPSGLVDVQGERAAVPFARALLHRAPAVGVTRSLSSAGRAVFGRT